MNREKFIKKVEKHLDCKFFTVYSSVLYFKSNTAKSALTSLEVFEEFILPLDKINRKHNILIEVVNPEPCALKFVFIGMSQIPSSLTNRFGGKCPQINAWELYNMPMHNTDSRGHKKSIAPNGYEVINHILRVYRSLNPNLKRRDGHKVKAELLYYHPEKNLWECGYRDRQRVLQVSAPAYLGVCSHIYIDTSTSLGDLFNYYGKHLCDQVDHGDYAKLFATHPEAVYDWFYSQDRTIDEIVRMFESIEHSYIARPFLYYCKGEYTKLRRLFLVEAMRVMHLKTEEEIKKLPKSMRISMRALCRNKQVSQNAVCNHHFSFEDALF